MDNLYNTNVHLNSDACWMNAKDKNNNQLEKYSLYNNDTARHDTEYGSLPVMLLDHVNLHGRPGYGLADDYLVDTYSALRNNKDGMTRDRCPVQLMPRMFVNGPKLTGKTCDINNELDVLSGSDSRTAICNRHIMEQTINNPIPMLDCIKDVQDPNNIVGNWTRGGEDTRSYVNKVKFNKCNKNMT